MTSKKVDIAEGFSAGNIAVGCMRIRDMSDREVDEFIDTALLLGMDLFDHADIYGGGMCEQVFGNALKRRPMLREKLFVQTKCGIKPGIAYDFSKAHILTAVNGSLKRLGVEYIDSLLLHRPDTLMEPAEVAEAFDELHESGKVRHFGVSNFKPLQIELLKTAVKRPILINQLQFSATETGMIDSGMCVNTRFDGAVDRDGSILEYSRIHGMTVQAWSPFQSGFFGGVFIGSENFKELNAVFDKLAEKYGVTPTAIASAFILRHPAKFQIVTGTTKPSRLKEIAAANSFTLTKEEWYAIYIAGGKKLP